MRGPWKTTLAVTLVLVAAGTGAEGARAFPFAFGNPEFCKRQEPLRDFGFSRLPPVTGLPTGEGLPFAPPEVRLPGTAPEAVLTKGASVGYTFVKDGRGTVALDWTVTAQLWRLSRRGLPVREVDAGSLRIGRLGDPFRPSLSFAAPGEPGFYRFDLRISDGTGTLLGSYATYLKVARPLWRVRLRLDRRVYRPGQLLLSRPDNLGTEEMMYEEWLRVQRLLRGEWTSVDGLHPESMLVWTAFSTPGRPGICSALGLPRDIAAGRYRILKPVRRLTPLGPDRTYWLTAPFQVRG